MFKTLRSSFHIEGAGPEFGRSLLLRWGGGVIIAAVEFLAIYTVLLVWE